MKFQKWTKRRVFLLLTFFLLLLLGFLCFPRVTHYKRDLNGVCAEHGEEVSFSANCWKLDFLLSDCPVFRKVFDDKLYGRIEVGETSSVSAAVFQNPGPAVNRDAAFIDLLDEHDGVIYAVASWYDPERNRYEFADIRFDKQMQKMRMEGHGTCRLYLSADGTGPEQIQKFFDR